MTREREDQSLRNVLADIARQGDTPIEVVGPALGLIYRRLGFSWHVEEETREVDAMALEALTKLALSTPPARPGREKILTLIRNQMMSNDYPVSAWEEEFASQILALFDGASA